MSDRLEVRKTYKLFIGGAFPRSESGRSDPVADAAGKHWANASRASRKDVREAVGAAGKALGGWSGRTAYNRGQVLYRVAEVLEGRSAQFAEAVERAEGVKAAEAGRRVAKAVDRLVWYAGWADKLSQVFGTVNPVAGPFANWSTPEPSGVVGVVAPPDSALLGLVSRLAPVITGGNTAVVLAPESAPLPAIDLAEVLATSDVPGGVVNILTGRTAELLPPLAAHMGVHGIDLAGVRDPELRREAELAAAENVKRVAAPLDRAAGDWLDDACQDPWWIAAFMETKTTWHPAGV